MFLPIHKQLHIQTPMSYTQTHTLHKSHIQKLWFQIEKIKSRHGIMK